MQKILLIEDEALTRTIFVKCLNAKGFNTISAENGLVGLQKAKEHLPDLVICDIMMPELDGYGVLTALRQDPATAIIPFIFLTAKSNESEIRRGMELGADDYLTKPTTPEKLLRAISARMEKQVAIRQWYGLKPQQFPESPSADTVSSASPQSIFPFVVESNELLNEIFRFIEDNYHQSINLCDVAQAVSYSPAYLTNLMKRRTGRSIYSWIIERRMAEARFLLLETDLPVNQIAVKVGYPDVGHFMRQFRQSHKMSARTWRASIAASDTISLNASYG